MELGYHRGELGIVSMSLKDMKFAGNVVPTVPGGKNIKAKKSSTFSNLQDVVLMTLTGVYHGGGGGSGKAASSFEKDDVFIKELELFVTDSLWCYLRLHGLTEEEEVEEESSQKQTKRGDDDDDEGGDLGMSHSNESGGVEETMRNGSRRDLRADYKIPVLSRVFKRVIGE